MRSLKLQTVLTFLLLLVIGMLLVELVAMQLWRRDALRADRDILLMNPSQSLLGNRSGWTP